MNTRKEGTPSTTRQETQGLPIGAQESRRLSPHDFLRLLLRQCRAAIVEVPNTDSEYAANSAYGQIATWIQLWLVDDTEDKEKTLAAKKRALETILQDERREFDSADDLVAHLWRMTKEEPTYINREAMFMAVHLFCSDYMTAQSVKTGKNLFIEEKE